MTTYHVDAAQVAQAATRANASGETIRSEVAALVAQLSSLESSWQGGASAAFAGLLQEWRAAQAQLEHALDSMSVGLSQAASQYEQAEANAARMFHR